MPSVAPPGRRRRRTAAAAALIVAVIALAFAWRALPDGDGLPSFDLDGPMETFRSTPGPTGTPIPPDRSITVATVRDLLSALADDRLGEIIVADGEYKISAAMDQKSDSLFIGDRFATRTRPIVVRAETVGGVTFSGGGQTEFVGIAFENGAHDQTWEGFRFADMVGMPIEFGGFTPTPPAHHITLRNVTIEASCHRASESSNQEQGIYFANASGIGPHDLLLEDITVDGSDPLSVWSAIHAYHGDASDPPASQVTIRRLTVTGTTNAIVLWNDTGIQRDWLIQDAAINGARDDAIRFESIGAQNIVFDHVNSRGSGDSGFYSSLGADPPGVTFIDSSLH